jgi:hypothetical protein
MRLELWKAGAAFPFGLVDPDPSAQAHEDGQVFGDILLNPLSEPRRALAVACDTDRELVVGDAVRLIAHLEK